MFKLLQLNFWIWLSILQEQYQKVTEDCTQILDLNPYSKRVIGKALMCKAQAFHKLNKNEEALSTAKQWTQTEPKVQYVKGCTVIFHL